MGARSLFFNWLFLIFAKSIQVKTKQRLIFISIFTALISDIMVRTIYSCAVASMQTILNGSADGEPAYCRHQQSAFANGNKNLIKNFNFKQVNWNCLKLRMPTNGDT